MLFNSIQFAVFFAVVYPVYLLLSHRWQNRLLLAASYAFYATWDWRFLSLIALSTYVDFICGLRIRAAATKVEGRRFLVASIVSNLSILAVFKYFNFFTENLQSLAHVLGGSLDVRFIEIVLPVGISFYTFQSMSYSLDVYRRQMEPTEKFWDFALYVAFFPQLVAGPIERAKHFLPQVLQPRSVRREDFFEGAYMFFWGLFLKVFIADNLSLVVDPVYGARGDYAGASIMLATYAFMFQIFCDFAGYSSMARGLGRMMGFEIALNFNLPFFVTNIQDYWNRWHISLSQWIRDYLYFPLVGGLRTGGKSRIYIALIVSMSVIGLWHGAAWTYVVFGVYYGALLCLYVAMRSTVPQFSPESHAGKLLWTSFRMVVMFNVIAIGMMLFRAEYILQPIEMLSSVWTTFYGSESVLGTVKFLMFHLWLLVVLQIAQYRSGDLMWVYKSPLAVRTAFYVCGAYLILMYGKTDGEEFIYFQF